MISRITLIGICAFSFAAIAATPATHSDAPEHAWYEQQYNLRGGNCCGLGDAYVLDDNEWKDLGQGHYEVEILGKWYPVEGYQRRDLGTDPYNYQPLRGTPAPSKKAVVWFSQAPGAEGGGMRIYCFSPWENLY
jgi:hypothetical protein